jgi:hypothetical protein
MLDFDPWISYLIQLQIAIEYKECKLTQLHNTLERLQTETQILEKEFLTISHGLSLLKTRLP